MCCEPEGCSSDPLSLEVVAAVSAAGAAAIVFLIVVLARQGLERAGVWAGVLGGLAGIVAAVVAVLVLVPRRPDAALLPEPEVALLEPEVTLPPQVQVPEWVVDRPAELTAVVSAVMDAEAETVGISTGLYGARRVRQDSLGQDGMRGPAGAAVFR